jgi:hypothetical protein
MFLNTNGDLEATDFDFMYVPSDKGIFNKT